MTITSLYFFIFLALGVLVYYIVPKKIQWIILMIMSIAFYIIAANPLTILYLVAATLIAYFSTIYISKLGESNAKKAKYITYAAVVIIIILWLIPKGNAFWILPIKVLSRFVPSMSSYTSISPIGALGMGYYTLQVIGYIFDVYRGKVQPQRNILKLFLFVSFFPQLTVGPISKYSELESLFDGHTLSYHNLAFGCQRILWGLMKKLILADRLGQFLSGIWNDTVTYNGLWIWIAVILYPLQLYADFSGCIDIVLGAAELFDIHMPENFNNPFFSLTVGESWNRWHITLSRWFKEYVYIPLGGSRKGRARKYFNSFMVFLLSGIWHGNVQYIPGFALYFWVIITLSDVLKPVFNRINGFLHVNTDSFSWKTFQRLRTYMFYAGTTICFAASSPRQFIERLRLIKNSFGVFEPWTLFDGTILKSGFTYRDLNLLLIGFVLLVTGDCLRERFGYARNAIAKQGIIFRWLIWIGLLMLVLVYGMYGPGYDAAAFIYQGF